MASELYRDRVRDLVADAGVQAELGRWEAVRALVGAALALDPDHAEALALATRADDVGAAEGERRQLTVMFCDVVGSTALSEQRDPELVREVLRSYQATCDKVVRRYDGRIARYVGDGVLVYFGHPIVHEDDARRGVQAGVDLLAALQPVTEEVRSRHDIDLQVRVAVHTGLVVRADMGSASTPDRDAIVGETPNLAARLQDHASPGRLIISQATYDLVRGWFLVVPKGALALRGLSEPVHAYEVVEATSNETRIEAQVDLSPFVGREDSLAVLDERWGEVLEGAGRTVVVSGQPGVGKTRLTDVLRRRVQASDGSVLVTSCSTFHGSTALYPVRRLLERAAGIDVQHEPRRALPMLWTALEEIGLADALPLFADLLGVPPEPWCPAPELEGAKLREEVLASLVRWIAASASRSPLLVVVDDLQWADPTTIELVGRLVLKPVPGVLLVLAARDDYTVPWSAPDRLTLERLSPDELTDLARRLPEGRSLSRAHLDRVVERSDGIPLFLEELLRSSALAQGDEPRAGDIPAALRDLLLARFAAPGVDLAVAQALATIGAEAPRPVLERTSGLPAGELDRKLAALIEVGIISVTDSDTVTYRFRHQLLADLAYDTQLRPARRRGHGLVADALLEGAGSGASLGPAVLAHHLERAGRIDEAVLALTSAAEDAHALGAYAEANALLEHAFGLLDQVEPAARPELEFEVRLLRGISAASTMGYAAPQATTDFQACRGLVRSLQSDGYLDESGPDNRQVSERVWSASGLWATFLLQGRLDDADHVIDDLLGQLQPDGILHRYFDASLGFGSFFRGDYVRATEQIEGILHAMRHIVLPARLAIASDPEVAALAHLGYALGVQCDLEGSRRASDRALERARSLPFPRGPFSVCYAAGMRAAVELFLGDAEVSAAYLAEQTELADRHGFTFWTVVTTFYKATVDLYEGDEGASQRAAMTIALMRALGIEIWLPSFLAVLGSAHLTRGEGEAAEGFLAEAMEVADRIGAHYWTAEITRQRGVARLLRGDPDGIRLVRDAIDVAVSQGATLHELWARTTLCEHSDDSADHKALASLIDSLGPEADLVDVGVARALLADRR